MSPDQHGKTTGRKLSTRVVPGGRKLEAPLRSPAPAQDIIVISSDEDEKLDKREKELERVVEMQKRKIEAMESRGIPVRLVPIS
jgi:hypothetical protein